MQLTPTPTEAKYIRKHLSGEKPAIWQALGKALTTGWPAVAARAIQLRPEVLLPEHESKLAKVMRGLQFAGDSERHTTVVRVLLEAGINDDWNQVLLLGTGPLRTACLLDAGADINGTPDARPLHAAIELREKSDTAMLLLERGADIEARDEAGRTPLIVAATCAKPKIVDMLLERGADTTAVDQTGRSAFRQAVEGCTWMNRNVHTITGMKASRSSASKLAKHPPGQPEDLVLSIIFRDADMDLSRMLGAGLPANQSLKGAIGRPFGKDWKDSLQMWFQEASFDPEAMGLYLGKPVDAPLSGDERAGGSSLLLWATMLDSPKCARVLIEYGADPHDVDGLGTSPASYLQKVGRGTRVSRVFEGRD